MSGPTPPQLPDGRDRHERICLYGGPDAGKTRAYLSVAAWHQKRGSDAVFYVLSTDMAYEASLDGEFAHLTNVAITDVASMGDYIDGAQTIRGKMRSQDWFSIDLMDDAWAAAQDEFADRKWGSDLAGYWVTKVSANAGGDDFPVEGWDWGPINRRYRSLTNNLLMRMPGHVMCMSREAPLRVASRSGKGGEKGDIKQMFERLGLKPAGQKDDPHRFHSVIYLSQHRRDEWRMVTARDRNREKLEGAPLNDFFRDYLMRTGGWRP